VWIGLLAVAAAVLLMAGDSPTRYLVGLASPVSWAADALERRAL